jgi:hypothetical protein
MIGAVIVAASYALNIVMSELWQLVAVTTTFAAAVRGMVKPMIRGRPSPGGRPHSFGHRPVAPRAVALAIMRTCAILR